MSVRKKEVQFEENVNWMLSKRLLIIVNCVILALDDAYLLGKEGIHRPLSYENDWIDF